MKKSIMALVVLVALILVVMACGAPTPTATPVPTATPELSCYRDFDIHGGPYWVDTAATFAVGVQVLQIFGEQQPFLILSYDRQYVIKGGISMLRMWDCRGTLVPQARQQAKAYADEMTRRYRATPISLDELAQKYPGYIEITW